MAQLIHYTQCPVCGSTELSEALHAKDYTVSGETFTITACAKCTLRFTQDVPDAATIGPYYKSENYISHTNTSKGLINRMYQAVRRRTLRSKYRLLVRTTGKEKGRLLDIGSGTGAFAGFMQAKGWTVTGLEPDADARTIAAGTNNITLQDLSGFYELPPHAYDAITLWHVLEHVHDLQAYVQQLRNLLAPGGKLFIAVPNYTSLDAKVYGAHWAAWDVPRHLYHFSPAAMKVLLEKNGLTIEAYKPMWYDSFYISLLSSQYKSGKASLVGAFITGLRANLRAMRDVKKCSSVIYIASRK